MKMRGGGGVSGKTKKLEYLVVGRSDCGVVDSHNTRYGTGMPHAYMTSPTAHKEPNLRETS